MHRQETHAANRAEPGLGDGLRPPNQLSDGRKIRSLTVVDIFARESLAIEVGQSLKGEDVVAYAEPAATAKRGVPKGAVL